MDKLPNDPFMLLSFVNTRLRDGVESPEALCDDLGVDCAELRARLAEAGFEYIPQINQFR